MKLSKEDRARICARLFYEDNREDYADYREALVEFITNKVTDSFMNTVIVQSVSYDKDYRFFVRDDGHVVKVRISDKFCSPVTRMDRQTGEKFEIEFDEKSDNLPEHLDEYDVLKEMGWREIVCEN